MKEAIRFEGTREVDPATGETTIVFVVGGQRVKVVLLSDERREGLRVELSGGLLLGREVQHGTNGETRERIRFPDGTACIRTLASEAGWQNAHVHQRVRESYLVRAGQVLFAERDGNGELRGHLYRQGEEFRTIPGRAHNLYVFAGADFLTTKHGGAAKDWVASPELDRLTRGLSEATILARFSS